MLPQYIMTAAMLLPALVNSYRLVPYNDSSCTNQITALGSRWSSDSEDERTEMAYLDADNGISNLMRAGSRWYYNLDFPDASAIGDTGNKGVWWKIDQPDNQCGIVLLKEYMNKMNWQTVPGVMVPGDILINARKNGCYFSAMPSKVNLGTTFCCGRDDCNLLDLDTDALNTKRDVPLLEERSPVSHAARASELIKRDAKTATEAQVARAPKIGKNVIVRDDLPDFDWTKCSKKGWGKDDYIVAPGRQTAVTKIQPCDAADACDFTISETSESSTSISSSQSQEVTSSVGTSVTVEAGSELLGGSVSGTFSYELSVAIAKESGQEFTTTTSSTVSQNIKQPIGTRGFLSFTPLYHCWNARFNCHGDVGWTTDTSEFTYCVPQKASDGTSDGYYTVVVV